MSKLGMHCEAPIAPDLYGLPEYKISEVITEIDGPDVRMVCGCRKFGVVHWLYSVVMNAETYLAMRRQFHAAAEEVHESLNLSH
jgi:hypothetical protein